MSLLRTIFILSFFALLTACAAPAKRENMSISAADTITYSAEHYLSENVSVGTVTGGKDTNPLWTSEISSSDFAAALSDSLSTARLFNVAASAGYTLDAKLIEVDQPMFGFSMTVRTTVQYTLRDSDSQQVVLQEVIYAEGKASPGDAFSGVKRLRLATERSAQENIKKIVGQLYGYRTSEAESTF